MDIKEYLQKVIREHRLFPTSLLGRSDYPVFTIYLGHRDEEFEEFGSLLGARLGTSRKMGGLEMLIERDAAIKIAPVLSPLLFGSWHDHVASWSSHGPHPIT